MRPSVIGILGVAAIAAVTAISVALKPRQGPPPAAAAAMPDLPEAEANRGEAPWPTTGISQSAGRFPTAAPADVSPAGQEPALRRAEDRSQLTSEELKARRDERRAQREMLRAQRLRETGRDAMRGPRRSSRREEYAEQRARALEAARAQPQVETIEEPAADPAPEEPLPDQMEAEVPVEPDEPSPEEPS